MKITLLLFVVIAASLVALVPARDIPKDPSLEYEIIDPKSIPVPTAGKPSVDEIGQANKNKTFVYDPVAKQWTVIKPTDEIKDGTLLWNQNNDKWLTQSFIP